MDVNKSILKGSDIFSIKQTWDAKEAAKLPARTLAYIGDAVYELSLRLNHVAIGIDGAGKLHDSLVGIVNSPSQAKVFDSIFPELPEDEMKMVKTWRNSKIPVRYGSGTRLEYAKATALEAWVGYLFVTGQTERLFKIIEVAIELSETKD
jgi:ribonuclease-3 family protein